MRPGEPSRCTRATLTCGRACVDTVLLVAFRVARARACGGTRGCTARQACSQPLRGGSTVVISEVCVHGGGEYGCKYGNTRLSPHHASTRQVDGGKHALEAQHGTLHSFEEIMSPHGAIRPRGSRGRSLYPADGWGGSGMSEADAVVFVVDDDSAIRDALTSLLRSAGLAVETFGSAQEFCTRPPPDGPTCLVLDVRLPGVSGLELQQELAKGNAPMPTIFLTGHGDIPMTVRAMKAGAIDFLTKPFHDQDLLNAIAQALHRGRPVAPGTHTRAAEQL